MLTPRPQHPKENTIGHAQQPAANAHDIDWRCRDMLSLFFERINVMTIKTKFAAVSVAAVLALSAASTAYAYHMKVMHRMTVKTQSGTEVSLDVVKMDGHMMVLVPDDLASKVFFYR
jgi:hypothetical protein